MKHFVYNNAGPTVEEYEIIYNISLGLNTVLEFGPGSSTWAFIEANVKEIISYEFDKKWLEETKTRFNGLVDIRYFDHTRFPLTVDDDIENRKFDLILVDSPIGLHGKKTPRFAGYENCSRWNTLEWASRHTDHILLHDSHREGEQESIRRLIETDKFDLTTYNTEKGIAELKRK